ncbi:MAG: aldolase/citrate lyase family protein [Dehalococcoidia bacterium]|jgi:4-hydroxy-2-oxoheptanedioate aldolase|nr:aldolase/citrate lyase family protein [Dehalococcoidia bacterium]
MRPNHVLRAWRDGGQTVGGWLSVNAPTVAEAMAHQDFDWLCIDTQHGLIEYADVVNMLIAISTTDTIPFVRVPWNDPPTIMKYLDAGAYGIIVPMVNNREEAERAVAACRYPPVGGRSFGPARAGLYSGPGYAQEANDEIACIVMIETAEALDNLDEIMSTPGVDAAYIGPSDLAYAIGMQPTGDNNDPGHVATVERIFEAAKKHGVAPGIHTGSAEFTARWLKMGFQLVMLGADRGFMVQKAVTDLRAVREEAGVEAIEPGA